MENKGAFEAMLKNAGFNQETIEDEVHKAKYGHYEKVWYKLAGNILIASNTLTGMTKVSGNRRLLCVEYLDKDLRISFNDTGNTLMVIKENDCCLDAFKFPEAVEKFISYLDCVGATPEDSPARTISVTGSLNDLWRIAKAEGFK